MILRYHAVAENADYCPASIAVTPAMFDRQMAYLAARYTVIGMDEVADRLADNAPFPPNAVCVTFDDGYLDNCEVAAPILARHGLTATFYCAAGPVLRGARFWVSWVHERVARCADPRPLAHAFGVATDDARGLRARLSRRLLTAFATSDTDGWPPLYERIAAQLAPAERAGLPSHAYMMQERHIRRLAEAGMTIGSHTVHHPILASVAEERAEAELTAARSMLEAAVRRPVQHLAYPNGPGPVRNFTARTESLAAAAGYRTGATSLRGSLVHGADAFALRRQGVNQALGFAGFAFKLEEHRFLGPIPAQE